MRFPPGSLGMLLLQRFLWRCSLSVTSCHAGRSWKERPDVPSSSSWTCSWAITAARHVSEGPHPLAWPPEPPSSFSVFPAEWGWSWTAKMPESHHRIPSYRIWKWFLHPSVPVQSPPLVCVFLSEGLGTVVPYAHSWPMGIWLFYAIKFGGALLCNKR